jgi:predicted RNA methylase
MGHLVFTIAVITLILAVTYNLIKALVTFAPWVPTFAKDMDRVFELAHLQSGEVFMDLGAGNGRMIFAAVQRHQVKAIGVELSLPFYLLMLVRQVAHRNSAVTIKFGDLFKADISQANVIYIYGLPDKIQDKLAEKILREARSDVRIISYCFEFTKLALMNKSRPTTKDLPIYLYQKYAEKN